MIVNGRVGREPGGGWAMRRDAAQVALVENVYIDHRGLAGNAAVGKKATIA